MSNMHPETIPFVDLVGQYRRYKDELDAAIKNTIENASFIGGPANGRFEEAFAKYCGVKHCVGVANGTDALYLILRAFGIGKGDEVILPVNTFIATAEAVTMAGARPVFADVDDKTALIDPQSLEAAITEKTKVLMPVHLYGQLADMRAISAIAAKKNLIVIEDSAQAHGAEMDGKRAGSFGRATGFSFYPGKNLGAYGDAGALVTNDTALADKARRTANHGRAEKFGHEFPGVNSRLDGLQAAILEVKLKYLDTWISERRRAAKRYDELLKDIPGVVLPVSREEKAHVYHLYVVRVKDRDGLKKHFGERNIQCGIHYPTPLHLLPAYADLGYKEGRFPVAEKMAPEIISLPMSPEITEEQQHRVAQAIKEFVSRGGRS